jgi:hypothetical protein
VSVDEALSSDPRDTQRTDLICLISTKPNYRTRDMADELEEISGIKPKVWLHDGEEPVICPELETTAKRRFLGVSTTLGLHFRIFGSLCADKIIFCIIRAI